MPLRERLAAFARAAAPWLLVVLPCAIVFGPGLVRYFASSFDPHRVADDARIQIPYYYHYADARLFDGDLLSRYHTDGQGDLVRLLYIGWSKVADPLTLSRLLPIPVYAAALVGIAVAGDNVAGKAGAFVALALYLGASAVVERTAGGIPRAFVVPLLSWLVACLTGGWVWGAAIVTALGAGFYPVVTVIGGLSLALLLLAMPAGDRGPAASWSLRRRFVFLAVTAFVAGALILPFALRMREYGVTVTPAMLKEFPEAGRGGRPAPTDCAPFPPFFEAASAMAARSVIGAGDRLVPFTGAPFHEHGTARTLFLLALSLLSVVGLVRIGWVSAPARRLAAFVLAVAVGYVVANAVTPALVVPQRYARYGIPTFVPVALAAALLGLLPARWRPIGAVAGRVRRIGSACIVTAGLLLVLIGAGSGPQPPLEEVELLRADTGLYRAVGRLPKNAVIAGWPKGVLDQIPLVTRRIAFLNQQMQMPYHTKQTLMMRRRMRALIKAYFATDVAPLLELRDRYRVTHLVVEWSHLRGKPPSYFKPFRRDLKRALRAAKDKPFALERLAPAAKVYEDSTRTLIDLSRLHP